MEINDHQITKQEFEQVFKAHFKALHAYAYTILRESTQAEEIVQQVFYKIWVKKDQVTINQSLKAYLYQSVYNDSLNYLKHLKVKKAHQSHILHSSDSPELSSSKKLMVKELEAKIVEALKHLPEQCRTIFQMSRFEDLKYREIAANLNLSVKTVENQMGKALKIMRAQLAEYLPMLITIFSLIFYKIYH